MQKGAGVGGFRRFGLHQRANYVLVQERVWGLFWVMRIGDGMKTRTRCLKGSHEGITWVPAGIRHRRALREIDEPYTQA